MTSKRVGSDRNGRKMETGRVWGPSRLRAGLWLAGALLALSSWGCQADSTQVAKDSNKPNPGAAQAATGAPVLDECPHASKDSADDSAAGDKGSCDHEAPAASDNKHFGGSFTLAADQPLKQAVEAGAAGTKTEGRTVRVQGKVESVCQKAGCWMVLQDGDIKARVFTKQNRFFLPRDIAGKRASVEGKLQTRTVSEKFAKHLEEDRGGDPSKVTGPTQELLLYASVVELL